MDSTGLYWLGARYYDPVAGRFLSPDPLGHGSSASLYDYAGGDPVNRVDPDGRMAQNTASYLGSRTSGRAQSSSAPYTPWLVDLVNAGRSGAFAPEPDPYGYSPQYGSHTALNTGFNLTASRDGMTSYYQAPEYRAPVMSPEEYGQLLSDLLDVSPFQPVKAGVEFFSGRNYLTSQDVPIKEAGTDLLLGGLLALTVIDDLGRSPKVFGVHWTSAAREQAIYQSGVIKPSYNNLIWFEVATSKGGLKSILANGGVGTGAKYRETAIIVDLTGLRFHHGGINNPVGGGASVLMPQGMQMSGETGRGLTWYHRSERNDQINAIVNYILNEQRRTY